jgi:hypothetical protein
VKLEFVVASPVEAHQVINGLYREVVKPHTAKGAQGVLSWQTMSSWLHERHRAAFHGPVCKAFSDQVWFTDAETGRRFRYSRELWKHFLKQQFLEPKVEQYIARRGDCEEVRVRMLRLSTEDLTDDEYNEFLMEVQSFGVNECGVIFDEEI